MPCALYNVIPPALQTAHPAPAGAAGVRGGRAAEDVPRGLRVRALPLLQRQPRQLPRAALHGRHHVPHAREEIQ